MTPDGKSKKLGCYNFFVLSGKLRPLKSGELINIAFALIIMISLFSSLSTASESQPIDLILMILISIIYITIGIYGFPFAKTRQQEILYFCVQIILGASLVYLEKGSGYQALIFLPLVGQAVVAFSSVWSILVNSGILLGFGIAGELSSTDPTWLGRNLLLFIAGQVFVIVFTQMAVDEEKARINAEELAKNLNIANRQLQHYASQVELLATEKERNRLAREIHDGLGHDLTTINMQLQAALAVFDQDPQKAIAIFKASQELARHSLQEIRKSVKHLRDMPESKEKLSDQVEFVIKNAEATGILCNLSVVGDENRSAPEVSLTILRVLQEAISNALKHSKATRLDVTLDYSNQNSITMLIHDDGIGLSKGRQGFGFTSMKERVAMIAGTLKIETKRNQGTLIALEVPK